MHTVQPLACAVLLLAAFSAALRAETLSYPDLVRRLTDLERLAGPVVPGERVELASSYDRSSRYDAAKDEYLHWDANGDGSGIVREEGGQQVLADIRGPGCLWRIWSATADKGHVRIYLDGAKTPTVDLPFAAYFDRSAEPFNRPNLVYTTTAQGLNNYTPIPFQRSCRIVAEKGWGRYFQFTYTRFAQGTAVPTFTRQLSAADRAALDDANRKLGASGRDPAEPRAGARQLARALAAEPGRRTLVAKLAGPAAITTLRLRVDLPSDPVGQRRILRELSLSITWDGAATPAVWSPVGDFFASAAGVTPFATLPVGYKDGAWYCHWYMPFGRSAEIAVTNDGAEPVRLDWEITQAPLARGAGNLLRFHAKWHADLPPVRADRAPDWTVLATHGAGRFVGLQLHVWNPRGGWWGEGDEKFFVDGEKFPSSYGTGTEDYFGYAWSSGKTFVQALHSQPVNENNHGHVSVSRWHTADAVPFTRSFEAALEKYFPNGNPTQFRAVAYWYLAADGGDAYIAVPVAQRLPDETRPVVWRAPGVLEAEELRIVKTETIGFVGPQSAAERRIPAGACSNDRVLAWWLRSVGQRLEVGVPVKEAGRYRVTIRPLRDATFGTFQFWLAGKRVGEPLDAFAPLPRGRSEIGEPRELGVVDLPAGEQVLVIEAVGRNPRGTEHHFAFDYLELERVP